MSQTNPLSPGQPAAGFWGDQLDRDEQALSWLWHGYLAAGHVTLLTSQWKSGKTTLLANLLARLKTGGPFAGLPASATRAVVVSEESQAHWRPRHQKLGLGHVHFFCRPFEGRPTLGQWLALLERVAALRREGVGLLAVDTLATFLPGGSEANADAVLKALLPLQRLTADGLAVLLSHHPRKGGVLPGQAARGSGAFAGFADIVIEMARCPGATEEDRRRRLLAFSRRDETPRQLVLELNEDGSDYRNLGDFAGDDFATHWDRLRRVLEEADDKRTRKQILAEWPADFPRPNDFSLYRWLERAARLGLVSREGRGSRKEPFRYWLPSREAVWREDPVWQINRLIEESRRQVLEGFDRKGP